MAEYIEREVAVHVLMNRGRYLTKDLVMDAAYEVSKIPAADVAPVVRCKDCKSCLRQSGFSFVKEGVRIVLFHCDALGRLVRDDDFCSYGERKEGEG